MLVKFKPLKLKCLGFLPPKLISAVKLSFKMPKIDDFIKLYVIAHNFHKIEEFIEIMPNFSNFLTLRRQACF